MRPVHKELAAPVARGMLGAASVDGGPTDAQLDDVRRDLSIPAGKA
jgi:hypothetical protein